MKISTDNPQISTYIIPPAPESASPVSTANSSVVAVADSIEHATPGELSAFGLSHPQLFIAFWGIVSLVWVLLAMLGRRAARKKIFSGTRRQH